ncbi:hypothetical protein GCM10027184_22250 [Saccharothrix stipae]
MVRRRRGYIWKRSDHHGFAGSTVGTIARLHGSIELGTAIGCRDGFAVLPSGRRLGDQGQAQAREWAPSLRRPALWPNARVVPG